MQKRMATVKNKNEIARGYPAKKKNEGYKSEEEI